MVEAKKGEDAVTSYDDLIPKVLTSSYFKEEAGGVKVGSEALRRYVEVRFSGSPEERLEIFDYLDRRRRRLLGLIRDYRERLDGLERGVLTVEVFLNIQAGQELAEGDPLKRALDGEEPMFRDLIREELEKVPWQMMEDKVNRIARKAGVEDRRPYVTSQFPR